MKVNEGRRRSRVYSRYPDEYIGLGKMKLTARISASCLIRGNFLQDAFHGLGGSLILEFVKNSSSSKVWGAFMITNASTLIKDDTYHVTLPHTAPALQVPLHVDSKPSHSCGQVAEPRHSLPLPVHVSVVTC